MADQRATYEIKLKDNFSKGLSNIDKGVNSFEKKVEQTTKKSGSNFDSLKNKLIGLGLAAGAGMLIKNVANLGIEMEQTRVSFTTFLGSAEKANKAISDLNQFSNVTPFDNAQVIKAGKGLLAFGVAQDAMIPTLRKIGDISAGTGKDFNELATIYGKAKVAGTLYAEDINQLVEAGIPIMGEFAKALGVTESEVKKMASEGKLSFRDLENAFTNLTTKGATDGINFAGLMEEQSKTVGGRISTLMGALQTLGIQLGESMLPIIGFFADLALSLTQNTELLKTLAMVVGLGAAAWGVYQLATLAAAASTFSFSGAFTALNAAMAANPIGFVVAGLALLTAGIVVAWRHSETFRGVILGLWESAKTVFNNLVTGFTNLPNVIFTAIKGIPKAIADVFSGVGSLFNAIFGSGNLSDVPDILRSLGTNILKSNPITAVGIGVFEEFGKGAGEAFDKGFAKGKDKDIVSPATLAAGAQGAAATQPAAAKAKKVGSNISGSSPKNVTLNITKLIETINFNKQDMKQSTTQMTDMVKRALLTALNDVAIVQS